MILTAGSFEAGDKKKGTVLSSLDIVTTASANGDITSAIKTLPGTQQVGESEGLFVRGGTATESKIFIDGNLVNNFFYSTLPNLPSRGRFNPFLFKGTIFSSGGYSALYGQALSSALILETNDLPEKTEAGLNLSIVGIGATYQKLEKNKKASWGISYNYSNLWPAFKLIPQKMDFFKFPIYHEAETNFRIRTKGGMIKYYGYFSASDFGFRDADIDSAVYKNALSLKNLNTYQNLNWRESLGNNWKIINGISLGTNKDDISSELQSLSNAKVTNAPGNYSLKTFSVKNRALFAQLKTVLEKKLTGMSMLRFGAEHFYAKERSGYSGQSIDAEKTITENLTAAFAEADWYITPKLALKTGLRGEYTQLLNEANLAPRLTLAYKISKSSQSSLAYGRFYQNPETRYLSPTNSGLGFSKASHYILQYFYAANSRILRTEMYYKDYHRLYRTDLSGNISSNTGTGQAHGFEVFYRDKKSIKNFDYWLSYSYLNTDRLFMNYPEKITPDFASDHTLSLVGKKFVLPIKTGFNASYTFAAARPYYQIVNTGTNYYIRNRGFAKPYGDLSFSLNYLPNLGKPKAKAFSVLVLSVNNILGRKNIFNYEFGTINLNNMRPIEPRSKRFVFIGYFMSFGVDRTEDAINNNL